MKTLCDNWQVVIALVCLACMVLATIISFAKLPNGEKIKNVKEWLKWAVVQAEQFLGEKTGQLKLRMVYDMFCERFPDIAKYVSFETFSEWVDEALEWMHKQLESNQAIKKFIEV